MSRNEKRFIRKLNEKENCSRQPYCFLLRKLGLAFYVNRLFSRRLTLNFALFSYEEIKFALFSYEDDSHEISNLIFSV